jgi:hypothetical protein
MAQATNDDLEDRTIYNEDPYEDWMRPAAEIWEHGGPDGPGKVWDWTAPIRYTYSYERSLISGSAINAPRNIVYGTAQVTGQLIGVSQVSADEEIYGAYALCQGPVDSVLVYANGVPITIAVQPNPNNPGCWLKEVFLGANDQDMSAFMPLNITDWKENHGGLCYVVVQLGSSQTYQNAPKLTALPTITATVTRGDIANLNGGADVRSDNPVNALYDWWISEAAMRRDPGEIDIPSWEAVRDWCDNLIALPGGGTDYRTSFNLAMRGDTLGGNIGAFAQAIHSPGPVFVDSKWILWNFRTIAATTLTVTADDFAVAPTWGITPLSELPTHVSADYTIPGTGDEYEQASVEVSAAYDIESEDEQISTHSIPWCTNAVIAERWALHRLRLDRFENLRSSILIRSIGMDVLPGEKIHVTDRTGVAKYFRVLGMKYREDGLVELELQLYLSTTQVNALPGARGGGIPVGKYPARTADASTEVAHYLGEIGDWKAGRTGDPSNLTSWTEVTPADTEVTYVPGLGIEGYSTLRYTGAGTEDRIYSTFTVPDNSDYVIVSAQFYLETGFDNTLSLEYEVDAVVVSTIFTDAMAQLVPDMWHRVFAVVPIIAGTVHRINILVTKGATATVAARIRRVVVFGKDEWLHGVYGAYERWTWTVGGALNQSVGLGVLTDAAEDSWAGIASVPVDRGEISIGHTPRASALIPMNSPSYTYRLSDVSQAGGANLLDFSAVQSIEQELVYVHEGNHLLSTDIPAGNVLVSDGAGSVAWEDSAALTITEATTTYSIVEADRVIFCNASSAGFTVTLPAAVTGKLYRIAKVDSTGNLITIDTAGGTSTIDGVASVDLDTLTRALTLVRRSATEWIIV